MIKPVISVIIPVYNVEKYIRQCVDSVLEQSYRDFELILVDDGSPDNSPAICDEYAQKDTRVSVIHQKNLGVSAARNNGIRHAKGEWITFVDSDDWVDKEYLYNFHLKVYSSMDMVVQGLKYVDNQTSKIKRYRRFPNATIISPDYGHIMERCDLLSFGVTVCKCFRRELMKQQYIQFNELIDYHEDHLFTFDYIAHSKNIAIVSDVGYNYRCGHNPYSLSKKQHAWQKMNTSSIELMKSLKLISLKFDLRKQYYIGVATFCLAPKVVATEGVYSAELPINQKKHIMRGILTPLSDFSTMFFPLSFRRKPIRWLAKVNSYTLLHVYFMFIRRLYIK